MTVEIFLTFRKALSNAEEIICHCFKCSFLINEATTESFYLFKVTSVIDGKIKATNPLNIIQSEHVKFGFH